MTLVETAASDKLARLVDRVREVAALPLELATALPADVYTSDDLYSLEVDKIFRQEWMCIGRIDEIPNPGDFKSVDLVGEPLVITRDGGGELHVMSRVCRHRRAEVCEGSGNALQLQCPYHHWTYSLAGDLLSAPLMRENIGFDKMTNGLPEFSMEVWQGFIFVNLDGTAEPLGPTLTGLDALLEPYDLSSFQTVRTTEWGESAYDWKLLVDNYLECYHHLGVHGSSVQPMFPTQLTWTDTSGGEQWSVAHVPVSKSAEMDDGEHHAVAPQIPPTATGTRRGTAARDSHCRRVPILPVRCEPRLRRVVPRLPHRRRNARSLDQVLRAS